MARFACIRAEAEKRRVEVVMTRGGNDKIRILDIRDDEHIKQYVYYGLHRSCDDNVARTSHHCERKRRFENYQGDTYLSWRCGVEGLWGVSR
jgi:hypothetical protein